MLEHLPRRLLHLEGLAPDGVQEHGPPACLVPQTRGGNESIPSHEGYPKGG